MSILGRVHQKIIETRFRVPIIWLQHRGIHANDVLLASYPRSGSHWTRFQLIEILTGQSPDFSDLLYELIPDIRQHHRGRSLLPEGGRLVQTHEGYRSEYKKAIYLVRDIRDVVLSKYAQDRSHDYFYTETFDRYLPAFLQGKVHGIPPWPEHVMSWLESPLARSGDMVVVRYEDLRQHAEEKLTEMVAFLGVRSGGEVIRAAIRNNSLEQMREKEERTRNYDKSDEGDRHTRSGSVGGWRERLTREQLQLIETYTGRVLQRLGYPLAGEGINTGSSSLHTTRAEV